MERLDRYSDEQLAQRLDDARAELAQTGEADKARWLHELSVYQIELEMQNRELRDAQVELEQARDRYAALYDHAPVGYVTLDRKGFIQQCNATAAALLQVEPVRVTGKPFGVYVVRQDQHRFLNHLRRAFDRRDSVAEELVLHRVDGTPVEVRLQSRATLAEDGRRELCLTAVLDLTEQRRAEAESRRHRVALAHAARVTLLGEMATAIAHETSQPLSAIRLYTGACRRMLSAATLDEASLTETLDKIAGEAERAGETVQGIRRFARHEELEFRYTDLEMLIREALGVVEAELRHAGVSAMHTVRVVTPVYVEPLQIEQVLVNLVHNAVEAMVEHETASPEIRIEAHRAGEAMVEVAVADNGPGVPAELREHLFMPFVSHKPEGMGLGLSLSRTIVEVHGGSLWYTPNEPRGASFHFTLPTTDQQGGQG